MGWETLGSYPTRRLYNDSGPSPVETKSILLAGIPEWLADGFGIEPQYALNTKKGTVTNFDGPQGLQEDNTIFTISTPKFR